VDAAGREKQKSGRGEVWEKREGKSGKSGYREVRKRIPNRKAVKNGL